MIIFNKISSYFIYIKMQLIITQNDFIFYNHKSWLYDNIMEIPPGDNYINILHNGNFSSYK